MNEDCRDGIERGTMCVFFLFFFIDDEERARFFLCVLFAGWNDAVMLKWWFYERERREGGDNGKDWCLCVFVQVSDEDESVGRRVDLECCTVLFAVYADSNELEASVGV